MRRPSIVGVLRLRATRFAQDDRAIGGKLGEGVADGVDVRVREPEVGEAFGEPGGAVGFAEGRCGDGDDLAVPALQLELIEMEPVKGAVDGAMGGESGDASVGGGSGGRRHEAAPPPCRTTASSWAEP